MDAATMNADTSLPYGSGLTAPQQVKLRRPCANFVKCTKLFTLLSAFGCFVDNTFAAEQRVNGSYHRANVERGLEDTKADTLEDSQDSPVDSREIISFSASVTSPTSTSTSSPTKTIEQRDLSTETVVITLNSSTA
jgi:hypothetical protein